MLNLPVKNLSKTVEVIACDKCKCTWLIAVKVNRYSTIGVSVTQQALPVHVDGDFNLLQCAACGTIVFPPVDGYQTGTAAYKLYDEMSTEIAGSAAKAEEKRKGTATEKDASGTYGHIPAKGST